MSETLPNPFSMKTLKVLPTEKDYVSFSEISVWAGCSFKHKLKYIDKIELEPETEYLYFGKAVHASCQNFLETRVMDDTIAIKYIEEYWPKLGFIDVEKWIQIAKNILEDVPQFMDDNFPNWEYVGAEEKIIEPIMDFEHIKFKGYIDAIVRTKDKKGNDLYWIFDWKTATYWSKYKKSDFNVRAQLIYYKNFWSIKHNIPLKQIRCAFILLKRKSKKGKRCELVDVSV